MIDRLKMWQERFERAKATYTAELTQMSDRDAIYLGSRLVDGNPNSSARVTKKAISVRNVAFELIESQINTDIPRPKVEAQDAWNEDKTSLIEDMLVDELDRMPFAYMNDEQERVVYIQGGAFFHPTWDSSVRTHDSVGDLSVSTVHPQYVIPQGGSLWLNDCDYVFVDTSMSKDFVKRRYGVDVSGETGTDAMKDPDILTVTTVYYRGEDGISLYSWVNDTELEDIENYQARKMDVCANPKCGRPKSFDMDVCECGCKKFEKRTQGYEELVEDVYRSDGTKIPALSPARNKDGSKKMRRVKVEGVDPVTRLPMMTEEEQPVMEPTKIPYYVPNIFPLVLRKNVSQYGKFIGGSDIDAIRDQQNALKTLGSKVQEKLLKGGSYVTLPEDVNISTSDEELKVIKIKDPAQRALISVITCQPNIQLDMQAMAYYYDSARSTLGITDAFQGKRDPTATSGVAKQFSASQSAGRLESKRIMKDAAYADLFEIMFKFMLAYADEERTYVSKSANGQVSYKVFNRFDFLEQDADGQWYWNDRFKFKTDVAGTLAQNRQAMWAEARMNFQQGSFGSPADPNTLLTFWEVMQELSYPNAAHTLEKLKTRYEQKAQAPGQPQLSGQPGQLGLSGLPGAGGLPALGLGAPGQGAPGQGAMPGGMPGGAQAMLAQLGLGG